MAFIIPEFIDMFEEFELDLPAQTKLLVAITERFLNYWFMGPLIPITMNQ